MKPSKHALNLSSDKKPAAGSEKAPTTRPDHNNPATLEQFDRERMGIAAQE